MLMGAALGFGMVSLAHALGLGSEHAQGFTMLLLLMLIVLFGYGFWRYVFKRPSFQSDGLAPNFMNSQRMGANGQAQAPLAVLGRTYNPKNVGNDASARPWESQSTLFSEASAVKEESTQRAVQKPFAPQQLSLWDSPSITPPTPAVKLVDVEQFIAMSKDHFLQLQDAWDHLDIERLSSFLSPEMFTLVKAQLAQLGLKPQKTEVMMLQAQWLGYETAGDHHFASVELSGMSREAEEASFSPFREIWSWTRPIADERAAWLVCGLEPLQ